MPKEYKATKKAKKRLDMEVIADFREWAFHVYYKTSYADVQDNDIHFVKALQASVAPIRREQSKLIRRWDINRKHEFALTTERHLAKKAVMAERELIHA